jgi:hypothetical protein
MAGIGGAFGYFVFSFPGSIPICGIIGCAIGVLVAVVERRMRPYTIIVLTDNDLILDGARHCCTWPLSELIAIDAFETSRDVEHSRLAFFNRVGERCAAAIDRESSDEVLNTFLDRTPWTTIAFADDTYHTPEGADEAAGLEALARNTTRMFRLHVVIATAVLLLAVSPLLLLRRWGGETSISAALIALLCVLLIVAAVLLWNAGVLYRGARMLPKYAADVPRGEHAEPEGSQHQRE